MPPSSENGTTGDTVKNKDKQMLLFYELAVMLKAAAGERVPKGRFSSFKGILNVHADTAAFHSCVSAGSASIIHGPLGPARAAHLTRYAFIRPQHATGHGAEEGLRRFQDSLSGVTDLPRCEAAAVTKRAVFYRDLCESWRVISPSRFISAIGNPGGGACGRVIDRKRESSA